MTAIGNALYSGDVVHKRLRPCRHALRYTVFSLLLDCSALEQTARGLRLFSYNRFNLFSVHDRDHTDGAALCDYLEDIANDAGMGRRITRFMMLSYPRVLGYVFNPLTVYFGFDADDQVVLTIYEVRNTFGGLQTYVLPARPDKNGFIAQCCDKEFYVSPFNAVEGRYHFHATPLGTHFTIGVALETDDGPLLKTHFRGHRQSLSDRNLVRCLVRTGWLTLKVITGIHFEALKLYLKGLRIKPRGEAAGRSITYVQPDREVA